MRQQPSTTVLAPVLTLAVAFGAVAGSGAQRDLPVARERIDVRLVEVDVVALDRRGRPIVDLDREDFELSVDGLPVEISTFSRPDSPAVPEARSPTPTPDRSAPAGELRSTGPPTPPTPPPPSTIVVVDERRLEPGPRRRALKQLAEWIRGAEPGSRWKLIRIDTRVRAEGASLDAWIDSASMNERVESLSGADSGNVTRSNERERLIEQLEDFGMCSGQALALVEQSWSFEVAEVADLLDSLVDLAVLLGGAPGSKTLVYVGEGLPLRPLNDIRQTIAQACPERRELALRTASGLERRLLALASAANAGRVTFHMLEASGLRVLTRSSIRVNPLRPASGNAPATDRDNTPGAFFDSGALQGGGGSDLGFRSPEAETMRRLMLQDSLVVLARATGGLVALNTNRLGPELERIDRYRSSRYVLGFAYEGPADGSGHRLEVRAATDRAELLYRRSFRILPPEDTMETRLRAAAEGLHSVNPLEASSVLERIADAGRGVGRYELRLRLPAERLMFQATGEGAMRAVVVLHLLARSAGGEPVTARRRETLELGAADSASSSFVVTLPLVLRDEKGRTLAVAVTDTASGVTSVLPVRPVD